MKGALQFVALQTSAKKMRACARPTARGGGKGVFTRVRKCGNEDKLSHTRARTRSAAHHAYANGGDGGGGIM